MIIKFARILLAVTAVEALAQMGTVRVWSSIIARMKRLHFARAHELTTLGTSANERANLSKNVPIGQHAWIVTFIRPHHLATASAALEVDAADLPMQYRIVNRNDSNSGTVVRKELIT